MRLDDLYRPFERVVAFVLVVGMAVAFALPVRRVAPATRAAAVTPPPPACP